MAPCQRNGTLNRKAPRKRQTPKFKPATGPKRTNSDALKAYWANPENRAKRKANPGFYNRAGTPDGMTKAQATVLWTAARAKADEFIKMLEDEGSLSLDYNIVPDSDEDKAKKCLREATAMALGPIDNRTKMQAINTVLAFCKEKPVQKTDNKVSADEWLAKAIEASKTSPPDAGAQ